MAKTTSISLGGHFTGFIKDLVGLVPQAKLSGQGDDHSKHETKHQALQRDITEGLKSGVAEGFSMDAVQQEMDNE